MSVLFTPQQINLKYSPSQGDKLKTNSNITKSTQISHYHKPWPHMYQIRKLHANANDINWRVYCCNLHIGAICMLLPWIWAFLNFPNLSPSSMSTTPPVFHWFMLTAHMSCSVHQGCYIIDWWVYKASTWPIICRKLIFTSLLSGRLISGLDLMPWQIL